jgi:putative flippase GtrA
MAYFAVNMTILKYLIVGTIAAIIDFSVFGLLVYFADLTWYWAACVSFLLATLANYLLVISFVFDSGVRFKQSHEVTLVFLVSLIGLVVNQIILYAAIAYLSSNLLIAKLIATGGMFFWNYFSRSRFIFKS